MFHFLEYIIHSSRFYIMSFFFEWLDEHESVGRLLGIKYEDDYNLVFNRKDTYMLTTGIYKSLVEWFIGIHINLDFDLFKKIVQYQFDISKRIKLNECIENLKGKKMSLIEFEDYLSDSFLLAINKEMNILSNDDLNKIRKHNELIRNIMNALTEDTDGLMCKIFTNIFNILDLRRILLSISKEQRLFLIVPQFTILNKFVEMIITKNGDLHNLEFYEFVLPVSFLTIVNNGTLYIIRRHPNKINSSSNTGFGVKGFLCPASKFVFTVITSIIDDLKKINIKINGNIKYSSSKRYKKNIKNKSEIFLEFD